MDIEKIKKAAEWADAQSVGTIGTPASRALWECIDEIERLRAALRAIIEEDYGLQSPHQKKMAEIAKQTLNEQLTRDTKK